MPGTTISVSLKFMDVEIESNCSKDYLQVLDRKYKAFQYLYKVILYFKNLDFVDIGLCRLFIYYVY